MRYPSEHSLDFNCLFNGENMIILKVTPPTSRLHVKNVKSLATQKQGTVALPKRINHQSIVLNKLV